MIHLIVTSAIITNLKNRKNLAPAKYSKQGALNAITAFGVFFRRKILQPSVFLIKLCKKISCQFV